MTFKIMTISIMAASWDKLRHSTKHFTVMLSVIMLSVAEHRCTMCYCTEYCYDKCHWAECCYAECKYAESNLSGCN
jgi:hypothetical protein